MTYPSKFEYNQYLDAVYERLKRFKRFKDFKEVIDCMFTTVCREEFDFEGCMPFDLMVDNCACTIMENV